MAKDQHEPQPPWFFTTVTFPAAVQLTGVVAPSKITPPLPLPLSLPEELLDEDGADTEGCWSFGGRVPNAIALNSSIV